MRIDKKVRPAASGWCCSKAIGKSVVTADYADAALRETLRTRCG